MNNTVELINKLQEGADLLPEDIVNKIIKEVESGTGFPIPLQLKRVIAMFCMSHISNSMDDRQMTREMKIFAFAIIVGYEEARRG